MTTGSCLCGAITFETSAPIKGASVCHCGQWRRQSGHLWASAFVPKDTLEITGKPHWFASSPKAERGFCPACGSFLFWQAHAEKTISIALGALSEPTGLRLQKHIFTQGKGDYYDIDGDLPQQP